MNTHNQSVLVTGAAGFIGSHVAKHLIRNGYHTVGVDDLSGGFEDNLPQGIDFHVGSVCDAEFVHSLFVRHKFDYVFHLAAYAAENLSHFIRCFNYENNLIGSTNLVNASVKVGTVKCFVFTSSIAVYGHNQLPMTEETIPHPEDPYGVAKYAVELDLRAAHSMFGLNHVIFRPHNVYGENQNIGDPYRNVVGIFMNQIMQGKPLTVFGDGMQTRAFTYIDDVAVPIAAAIELPEAQNQVFNVGSDQECTVIELARMVSRAMGVEPVVQHLPHRNEVAHAYSSHGKLRTVFNGTLRSTDLEAGITRMAQWARKVGPRQSKRFSNIEVENNLPESWRPQDRH